MSGRELTGVRGHGPVCSRRVTGGELFEDIVAREYYSEADARWVSPRPPSLCPHSLSPRPAAPDTGRQTVSWAEMPVCPRLSPGPLCGRTRLWSQGRVLSGG